MAVLSISEMIENININEVQEEVRKVERAIVQVVERAHSQVHRLEPACYLWGAGRANVARAPILRGGGGNSGSETGQGGRGWSLK